MKGARLARQLIVLVLLVVGALAARAAEMDDVWRYEGTITLRGTRSEGFTGALAFNGKSVPGKVGQIRTPIGEYKFDPAGMPWKPCGWLRTKGLAAPAKSGQGFEPGAHWYKDGWRSGTPGEWVWLPAHGYWADPDFLKEFAEAELKAVPEPESELAALIDEMAAKQPKFEGKNASFAYEQGEFAKGSKSAGERGALSFNGKPIPMRMGSLRTPIGTFHFVGGGMLWEAQGWFQTDDLTVAETATPFSKEDAAKGSYTGAHKAGTPTEWCYSPEDKSWFAPEKLM